MTIIVGDYFGNAGKNNIGEFLAYIVCRLKPSLT